MNNLSPSSARIIETRLNVRYAETDAMGIVYHANYLIWMEVGRTDYFRTIGLSYRELEEKYQLHTPLVEVYCRYLAAARYDDEVIIQTRLAEFNKRLIRFAYELVRARDDCLLARGESVHLIVNKTHQRASFPAEVLQRLQQNT